MPERDRSGQQFAAGTLAPAPPFSPPSFFAFWGVPECKIQVLPSLVCPWTLARSWEHLSSSFSFSLPLNLSLSLTLSLSLSPSLPSHLVEDQGTSNLLPVNMIIWSSQQSDTWVPGSVFLHRQPLGSLTTSLDPRDWTEGASVRRGELHWDPHGEGRAGPVGPRDSSPEASRRPAWASKLNKKGREGNAPDL